MSAALIQTFLNDLDRTIKMSGSLNEGVISEAFKDLLKSWARQQNLHFINQYETEGPQKNNIRIDGAILHDLRVPLGFWEAKDTKDDLEEEIRKKFAKGYPQENIIFENSETAILIQKKPKTPKMILRRRSARNLPRVIRRKTSSLKIQKRQSSFKTGMRSCVARCRIPMRF